MVKVVILGAAGFLGRRLATLLDKSDIAGQEVTQLHLVDVAEPDFAVATPATRAAVDLGDASAMAVAIPDDADVVFHLAAVVSSQAEEDFDLGMRANLLGVMHVLERCRTLAAARSAPPVLVFTSSVAIYGAVADLAPGQPVPESQAPVPASSYGAQKAIGELLVHDYSRKGFVDGRVCRLPTVSVRPGRPNRAASSFASGIIREPMSGETAVCPVTPETAIWVSSPHVAVRNLAHAAGLTSAALGGGRAFSLPGISVTAGEMVACLERVAGAEAAGRVAWEPDAEIQRIVGSWPAALDCARAVRAGFAQDASFEDCVREFKRELDASR
ncbi:unnamed protein product [Pedinophyceae sp. YPF-701]|nr:unnamed protein product [Pedinophyceae sp. YPF-701]